MRSFFDTLIDHLLPRRCLLCRMPGADNSLLCRECCIELPYLKHGCNRCAISLPLEAPPLCGVCLKTSPPMDRTFALFHYQEPISRFITQLKFHEQLGYAQCLGILLAREISKNNDSARPQALLPVPLHTTRLQDRGFNQSLEISKVVSKELKIPILERICMRHKATEAQSQLPAKLRKDNIRNAFSLIKPLEYKNIAIIDDVLTTGHTAMELSQVLKKGGADRVEVWCCARA